MSFLNLSKAIELAKTVEFYEVVPLSKKDDIEKSEEMLGIKVSEQHRHFLQMCNYLSFSSYEIYGFFPDRLTETLCGNTVAWALFDRKEYGLPDKWLPIYDLDDGVMAYLDYSSLNKEGEPRVIAGYYTGDEFVEAEVLAGDLGDFLLMLVEESLEDY